MSNPEAKKYADEAAAERTKRAALEARLAKIEADQKDAQRKAEEATLSEQQKLERKLADAQAAQAEQALSAQKRIVRAETKAAAVELGLNPELAARLVDFADIEFDDAGDPKNLKVLLEAAVKAYGLVPGQQPPKPATSGGATNPGRAAGTAQSIEKRPLRGWDDVNWSR
ncbi:MAG TPA: hypothetical protein VGR57_12150 [Ktedonobacterales bacterium]|nr:hypothetical protein [Ktedonobacterales bacterium]